MRILECRPRGLRGPLALATTGLALLLAPATSCAGPITFNFESTAGNPLASGASPSAIMAWMNNVLIGAGSSIRVTGIGAVTTNTGDPGGDHNAGGLSGQYIWNNALGGEFQLQFNQAVLINSVSYVVVANGQNVPDFYVKNFGGTSLYSDNTGIASGSNLTGTAHTSTPSNFLLFTDDGTHDVALDNLVINSSSPEPASWAMLGVGSLCAGVYACRRKRARAQHAVP
jgi:hypothetical protein